VCVCVCVCVCVRVCVFRHVCVYRGPLNKVVAQGMAFVLSDRQ
jgi:hypothetical protein